MASTATARQAAQEFLNAIRRSTDDGSFLGLALGERRPDFAAAWATLNAVPESDPEKFQVNLLGNVLGQAYDEFPTATDTAFARAHIVELRDRMATFAAGAATAAEVETGRTEEENADAAARRTEQLAQLERDKAEADRELAVWSWAEAIVGRAAIFGELPLWKVKVIVAVAAALGLALAVVAGVVIVRRAKA